MTIRRQEHIIGARTRPTVRRAGALLLALLLVAPALRAQSRSIRFDHLSVEEGLSQGTVNCILQDRTGFLWIGTQDGLNRHDGYDFVVYEHDPDRAGSLASNWITALIEDPTGDVWVGTEGGGLARWHRKSDSFSHYRNDPENRHSLPSNRIRSLLLDRGGTLWVGTFQSGLARLDGASGTTSENALFTHFHHRPDDPASLADDRVRALYQDRAGELWIGTLAGLDRFDGGSFEHHRLADDRVTSILEDHRGTLWVGTEAGLARLGETAPAKLDGTLIWALLEDREHRLWIGTDDGLYLLPEPTAQLAYYRHEAADPGSLSIDRVPTLFQDRGGVLWVGTQGGGLNRFNPRTWSFSHYRADPTTATGLSSNAVFAFSTDPEGRLWIGTFGGGLNVFDRGAGRFDLYRHDPADATSLSDDRVAALLHDPDDALWVGTAAGGLNRFDPSTGTFRRYRHDPARAESLSDDNVTSLHQTADEILWVGTFRGGLNRLERSAGMAPDGTAVFGHFRHDADDPHSLSDDFVTSFADGAGKTLWIGTFGGGLNRFDPERAVFDRFKHHPERPSSLSSNTVYALHVDSAGALWVGTQSGLNRLENWDDAAGEAVFERYFERDGLPSDVIWSIYSDPRDRLWMSTNNGIARFDPARREVVSYDRSHGLQGNEFNFGAHYQSTAGELFFGGTNGFNAFFPDRIERNDTIPPVVLTAFTKLNQPVHLGRPIFDAETIHLDHRDDIVSFEYAALDYAAPEKNRYKYKLEGFQDEWIDYGHRRRVTFTNLDPGRYVLRVLGSNNDGRWSEKGLFLPIRIAPPFWDTWWFKALALALLASAVASWHRIRTRRIQILNQRLQALVEERTRELEQAQDQLVRGERLAVLGELAGSVAHELRNPIGAIKNAIYLLRKRDPEANVRTTRLLGLMNREIDRSERIISELLDFARRPSTEKGRFPIGVIVDQALASVEIPPSVRVERPPGEITPRVEVDRGQVEQILVNLLTNAVQAMPEGGTLTVRCERRGAEVEIAVADDGVGIAPEKRAAIFEPLYTEKVYGIGLGLPLAVRYARMNGGRIECQSELGEGTTFRLLLPALEEQIDNAGNKTGPPIA